MAENNEDKNTGKYIDILNICANKENESGPVEDPSGLTKQFTAEEFNGIVRALQELYAATSDKEFWVNEFVDLTTGDTSVRNVTIKKGNPVKLDFTYYSKYRKGFDAYTIRTSDIADFTISFKKSGSSEQAVVIYDSKTAGEGGASSPIMSNTSFEFDVTNYLSQEGGKYEFTISGKNVTEDYGGGEENRSFVLYYHITVTDMSLEFANETWWLTPYIYGDNGATSLTVSFKTEGSGNRRVVLTASGSGITTKEYTQNVDSGSTSLEFTVDFPNRDTIMNLKAYMQNTDNESVKTDPIERNCIIVKTNPAARIVKLMAINNFQSTVKSGLSHKLFDYAVYDSTSTNNFTNLVFTTKVDKDGEVIPSTDGLLVELGKLHPFEYDFSSIDAQATTYYLHISAKDTTGSKTFMSEKTITVDNNANYSAVANAAWFLNPSGRSNSEINFEQIKNSMNNTYTSAVWNNITWSSNDGWVTEEQLIDGKTRTVSSLRIPSGSSVNINYQPLNMGGTGTKTIEFDYKTSNVSDFTLPVIYITRDNIVENTGIKIYPDKISTATASLPDSIQTQIATDDNVRLRVAVSLERGKSYIAGVFKNYVRIYIDGILAKVYEITSNDSLNNAGNIIIGSNGCDIDIYGIRVYNSALSNSGIVRNYINRLATPEEKELTTYNNDVLNEGKSEVEFKNSVDQYNVFVFDGNNWPSVNKKDESTGNLYLYSVNNIGGIADPKGEGQSLCVTNVSVKGQGTTSKGYYEWNLQFKTSDDTKYWPLKVDDNGNWYEDLGEEIKTPQKDESGNEVMDPETGEPIYDITYSNVVPDKKIPMFKGVPKTNNITMKKNWASSMQDHKIGSVNSYTELWKAMGFSNVATAKNSEIRVSVYQEPMLGFWKKVDRLGKVTYEYKGLFTGGPHKGDKNCFGYSSKNGENIISIEGTDNGPTFTNFKVPWKVGSSHVEYNLAEEAFYYDGVGSWDFNYGKYDSDDAEKTAEILKQFNETFHAPYTIAYECSQYVYPFEGTEEELIVATDTLEEGDYWTNDYNLYHIFVHKSEDDKTVKKVIEPADTGNGQINLLRDLGKYLYDFSFTVSAGARTYVPGKTTVTEGIAAAQSTDEKNEIFKKARLVKFREEAGEWWDLEDSIFHHCWIEFFAGTDQRAKNTYPYSFQEYDENGKLTKNGLWKWRIDDADTIGPIDNGGTVSKKYSVEVHDVKKSGTTYWNGSDNVFWNLIESLEDKYFNIMNRLFDLFTSHGEDTPGTPSERILSFYSRFFLKVKKYFPEVLYNNDAERYEKASQDESYKPTVPALNQSLGNAYSPEVAWYKKRIEYMTSKYAYGVYKIGEKSDTFEGRIGKNPNMPAHTLSLTTNIDMYPTADFGQSSIYNSTRQFADKPFDITFIVGSGLVADQVLRIHGASHYTDIGDWHELAFMETYTPDFRSFSSIKELNLGCENASEIISEASEIKIPPSLNKLYLENNKNLVTVTGLDKCVRLKNINAAGTSISRFDFASGAPLEKVIYSSNVQNIQFLNCSKITKDDVSFNGMKSVRDVYIVNSPGIPAIKIIKDIIEDQKSLTSRTLRYINVQGINESFKGKESVEVLELLNDLTNPENGYRGIDSTGQINDTWNPIITGKIGVEFTYEDTKNSLETFFQGLDITVGTYYIRFVDEEYLMPMLKDYMVACGWMKETETISVENAKLLTSFAAGGSSIFRENGLITSFDELKYFTSYTTVSGQYDWSLQKTNSDFYGCENLRSINLENIVSIGEGGFEASGIEIVYAPKLNSLSQKAFFGCSNLKAVQSLGTISIINPNTFEGCSSLTTIILPKECTRISDSALSGCSSLRSIYLPNNLLDLGSNVFNNCTSLETVYWNYTGQGTPSAPVNGFGPNTKIVYVNQSLFTRISAITSWKPFMGLIQVYDFEKDPNKAVPEEHKK